MKALIAFDSRSGYTEAIARAIGTTLGEHVEVGMVPASEALATAFAGLDLLVIGGPTEGHRARAELRTVLTGLGHGTLPGLAAAAFDTRLDWPKLLSGSAADEVARALKAAGCHLVAHPESFFVEGRAGRPSEAELEHARTWATGLVSAVAVPLS